MTSGDGTKLSWKGPRLRPRFGRFFTAPRRVLRAAREPAVPQRREAAGGTGHRGTGAACRHRAGERLAKSTREENQRREGTGGMGAVEGRRGSREARAAPAGGRACSLSSYQRLLGLLPRPPSLPLRRAPSTRPTLAPAGGGGAAPSLSAGGNGRRGGGRPGKQRDREGGWPEEEQAGRGSGCSPRAERAAPELPSASSEARFFP